MGGRVRFGLLDQIERVGRRYPGPEFGIDRVRWFLRAVFFRGEYR